VAEASASLQLAPDKQHPTTQFFTGRMSFLTPNQQHWSTEGRLKVVGHTGLEIVSSAKVLAKWQDSDTLDFEVLVLSI